VIFTSAAQKPPLASTQSLPHNTFGDRITAYVGGSIPGESLYCKRSHWLDFSIVVFCGLIHTTRLIRKENVMFGSLLNALSFSQQLASVMLFLIVCLTLFHFYMNWRMGLRRKGLRSWYLFTNYVVKFILFGGLIYTFEENSWLYIASSLAIPFILVGMCMVLDRMQLHYQWEFSGRRSVISARDMQYHLGHDLPAFIGIQAMLLAGWLLSSWWSPCGKLNDIRDGVVLLFNTKHFFIFTSVQPYRQAYYVHTTKLKLYVVV